LAPKSKSNGPVSARVRQFATIRAADPRVDRGGGPGVAYLGCEAVEVCEPLAAFEVDAGPGVRRLETEYVALDRTAFDRAAVDHSADAVSP
jgi:hypothetical protein